MCLTVNNPSDPCCESVPPVPVVGHIARWMRPEAIADYAGLSTASWQVGITGNSLPHLNNNCLYHVATSPNRRTTGASDIMAPIRWTIASPANDGDTFDNWAPAFPGIEDSPQLALVGGYSSTQSAAGRYGLREKFMPRNWHCRFRNDLVQLSRFTVGSVFSCSSDTGSGAHELALGALLPSIPFWDFDGSSNSFPALSYAHAAAHLINGSQVGPVHVFGHAAGTFPTYPAVRVRPRDTYQIDVWYRIFREAQTNLPPTPGKVIGFIPLTNVATGSERPMLQPFEFGNVDFSPKLNRQKQTYEVSVSGNAGWKLLNGSNGPHKMVGGPGRIGGAGDGGAVWAGNIGDGFCNAIRIEADKEIANVWFVPGPAMRDRHPDIGQAILYRSELDSDQYRRSTTSPQYGSVQHAAPGRFVQDGTTVFRLVPWTVQGGIVFYGLEGLFAGVFHPGEGRMSGGAASPVYSSLPRTITVSRVAL